MDDAVNNVGSRERVSLDPPTGSWWDRYASSLDVTPTARAVIESDSKFIVERCIFGAGPIGGSDWPEGRARQGLVMGAVQSGKTASMLGVLALALDQGVDIVVVLAGTRTSLWEQTYRRLNDQLRIADLRPSDLPPVVRPAEGSLESEHPDTPSSGLYSIQRAHYRRARTERRPIIAVVMKNPAHLASITKLIKKTVLPQAEEDDTPIHLLVIDDEADDGSILDARREAHLDLLDQQRKQIPRAINDMWANRHTPDVTRSPLLYSTYIGYTATPQANFLQLDHNPLAPKHFVAALRTPYDRGELTPRSETFREPQGLNAYYTGGDTFYARLNPLPLCSTTKDVPAIDVAQAVRAYLVAGAIKLTTNTERALPSAAINATWNSRSDAKQLSPLPHSMLIHTSPEVEDHFEVADSLSEWAFGEASGTPDPISDRGQRTLSVDAVRAAIDRDEESWITWVDTYARNAQEASRIFERPTPIKCPDRTQWSELRELILNEVVPHTNISVVNSDERADRHPTFDPIETDDGWRARPQLFSIFVSGNVMSRGLTLEGLTTTVFTRPGANRVADTRMQMQRWFGYRGREIHLCHVFLSQQQRTDFKAFHDDDVYLRAQILREMEQSQQSHTPAPKPTVLEGLERVATAKIQDLSKVPLCPRAYPFVRILNDEQQPDPNADHVAAVFNDRTIVPLNAGGGGSGTMRGLIATEPVTLLEAADILNGLNYPKYSPQLDGWTAERWSKLRDNLFDPDEPLPPPFFQPPLVTAAAAHTKPRRDCPYNIAAYLRLWHACTTRHTQALVDSTDHNKRWNLVDLQQKSRQQPDFYIGIRFGSGSEIKTGPLASLGIRPMSRNIEGEELTGTWGTQNPSSATANEYLGDRWFDYHHHRYPHRIDQNMPGWRPEGAPGLILFHIIDTNPHPTVAVGIGIPLGGPDQIASRAPSRPG